MNKGPASLILSLQIGRAAQGTCSQVQGSERSQKHCPSYQVGKGKAVSLSIAPWHLGNGQAGHWLHLTHQPLHLSEGGRTAAADDLITATTYSRAVVPKRKQIASRVVGSTVAASPSSSATSQPSQLTCSRLCWQHQPEPGSLSQLPHESPGFIPVWDENTSLSSFCGIWGCKELTERGCAAFSGKKKDWH